MTDTLTVPTHFEDVSSLVDGFVERVDDQRLILYGPEPHEEGAQLPFSVQLLDGTAAMQGSGRVVAAIDGGDEREPETRYDIVLDSLQLDGASEAVYERLMLAQDTEMGEARATGQVDVEQLDQAESDQFLPDAEEEDEATRIEADAPVMEAKGSAEGGGVEAPPAEPEQGAGMAPNFELGDAESTAVAPQGYQAGLDDSATAAAPEVEQPSAAEPQGVEVAESEPPAPAEPQGVEVAESEPPAPQAQSEPPTEAGSQVEAPVEDEAIGGVEEAAWAAEAGGEPEAAPGDEGESGEGEVRDPTVYAEDGHVAPVAADASVPPPKAAPGPPPRPQPFPLDDVASEILLHRPVLAAAWTPSQPPPPQPDPSSGLFAYGDEGLPFPDAAPRPELDPTYRVGRAPRPGDEGTPGHATPPPAAVGPGMGAAPAAPAAEAPAHADPGVAQPPGDEGDEVPMELSEPPTEGAEGAAEEAAAAEAPEEPSEGREEAISLEPEPIEDSWVESVPPPSPSDDAEDPNRGE